MAKLTKHAETLEKLQSMVRKQAEAQDAIVGKANADTKAVSMADSTETTDKNGVGADKVEQTYEQKPSTNESRPIKSASAVESLGNDILTGINKLVKESEAQTSVVGKPNADTKAVSMPDSTETVDQNAVKPETVKQDYEQKPSTNESRPIKSAEESIEVMRKKLAAYDLGVAIAKQLSAGPTKQASAVDHQAELLKEAGRKDFDMLIAQAEAELVEHQKQAAAKQNDTQLAKQAEQAGAQAFDNLYKEAALATVAQENEALKAKLASYAQAEQAANEQTKTASLVEQVASRVVAQLKSEVAAK